jgi:hypothetical protein
MATSTNYGWSEPDNTSLVKDGAQAMRTLGDAIDTSLWNVGFGQAGKNKIINGDFGIWQRGTSITIGAAGFGADRFKYAVASAVPTGTISRQSFTAGSAPVAGYEGSYFQRTAITANNNCTVYNYWQPIEDVRTFAGQTVTVSFWAKADASTTLTITAVQVFGSGGSSDVSTTFAAAQAITSSWVRYSLSVAIPSVTGKTIGTGSSLNLTFGLPLSGSFIRNGNYDIWGVQLEYGSKATPFQTASGGSLQAELAMCQRYYFRSTPGTNYGGHGTYGSARTTTVVKAAIPFPVQMRVIPTSIDYSTLAVNDGQTIIAVTAVALSAYESQVVAYPEFTVGSASLTQYRPYHVNNNNNSAAYLGFSAEL